MWNISVWVPSPHTKWNAVLQGETCIAAWVFHDCPYIYEDNQRSFLQHLQAPYGPYRVITTNNNYTIWCKISYFRCSLCKGNMRMWCREWHPLLLKCLINFLRYIRVVRRALDRLYITHMVHTMSFLKNSLLILCKISAFGHPLCIWEMGFCATRRDIHCCSSVSWLSLDVEE